MSVSDFSGDHLAAGVAVAERAAHRPTVLFVTRKWAPAVGGMETYALKLSEELRSMAEVEVDALPGRPDGSAPGFGAVLLFGLAAAFRIFTRRRAADIVHIGDMSSWPLAAIARLRAPRRRVVLSAHGTDVSFPNKPGLLPFAYGLYMRLGATLIGGQVVIANSRATAETVRGLGFSNVRVVPLATDMTSALDDRQPAKTGRTILFAGRLLPMKGCRWFIENVLPNLPDDVHLEVAGTVWDRDEEKALSHPRVRYLGPLSQDALRQAYANADTVVVPNIDTAGTQFEGFGLVAAEAAAAGGLVLASAHTGLKDALIDGVTGFSLTPGDAALWIERVTEVLNWPEDQREAFVRNAAAKASEYYSWQRVAAHTFDAYRWSS